MAGFTAEYENYVLDLRIPSKSEAKCCQTNLIDHDYLKTHETGSNGHGRKKFEAHDKVTANTSYLEEHIDADSDRNSFGTIRKNKLKEEYENYVLDLSISGKHGAKYHRKNPVHRKKKAVTTRSNRPTKRKLFQSDDEVLANTSDSEYFGDHSDTNSTEKPNHETVSHPEEDNIDKRTDGPNATSIVCGKRLQWVDFIKTKFLVTMPEDFYQFWDFCETLLPNNTLFALGDVGLTLVGPFDVLGGEYSIPV
ncbi:hypothetical protein JTB14_037677 [Gonioctena quinquepunctata]|nr:hypothetical protein JTB14_037677 [Gonioctena quinquepunctata]